MKSPHRAKPFCHPFKEAELVHGAGQPQNAAVPHQGRPNLAVFGNILPLEDIGHQADGDEAQNHGSGVDFRIRRGGPTDNGKDE